MGERNCRGAESLGAGLELVMKNVRRKPLRVLAVASGGGHWIQLMQLKEVFVGSDVVYVTIDERCRSQINGAGFYMINDGNSATPWSLFLMAVKILFLVVRIRPDVVISTGAAPGVFALYWSKLLKAKTIWLDSLANVERLSLSGRLVLPISDLFLTQWPHLEKPHGPVYKGAII